METKQASLTETLTEERVRRVGEKIAGLPTGDEFRQVVEEDLWREFTDMDEPPEESIEWEELPDESKSIFGYVDEEEETVPWWLESFKWEASSRGETIENLGDSLSNLENFDPTATEIHKPELSESSITTVLDKFDELADAIDDNVGVETEHDNSLPSDVFVINDGRVETTDRFVDWFEGLLELCPPFNEELTSLVIVNSNVKVETVEDLISDELLEKLENIGVINNGKIYQQDYIRPLFRFSDSILGLSNTFDIEMPNDHDNLEMLFYKSWAEGHKESPEEVSRWIERASDYIPDTLEVGERGDFAVASFDSPIRLQYDMPGYTTLSINSPDSKNSGYAHTEETRRKRRVINEIMQEAGILEE